MRVLDFQRRNLSRNGQFSSYDVLLAEVGGKTFLFAKRFRPTQGAWLQLTPAIPGKAQVEGAALIGLLDNEVAKRELAGFGGAPGPLVDFTVPHLGWHIKM